jgi:hypothetical protein
MVEPLNHSYRQVFVTSLLLVDWLSLGSPARLGPGRLQRAMVINDVITR